MQQTIINQDLISAEEYNLLMGAKPLTPELITVAYSDRPYIFDLVRRENIEYRYINGSCEDRAHYICLLLQNQGLTVGKIWNFAPARYTFLSNELFEITDPFGISKNVTWGYHVAPYIQSYNEFGLVESLIIDQSLSPDCFMTANEWLEKMNCPQAIHLYTDADSYLFNSIFGYVGYTPYSYETYYNTPLDIPSIITGNFWNLFPGDDYVQKGLAINDLAIEIYNFKQYLTKSEHDFLNEALNNIDEVIKLTATAKPDELSQHTYDHLIQCYFERSIHWGNKINNLLVIR
ncbi:MAG: hypothetical protein ACJA08_001024 [Cyclobacteriaceae bacterium]|jgi:hypothetical protein